ncbi:MAG TPA: hypothetical protein PKD12_16135 [Nitrospira sp.]|nr:hypothetical protein [Nitrospira sp.]
MILVTVMTVDTLVTLLVVPVFYTLIAAQHQAAPASEHEQNSLSISPALDDYPVRNHQIPYQGEPHGDKEEGTNS